MLFGCGGGPGGLFGGGGCGGSCCGGCGLFWVLFSFIHVLHIFLKEFRFPLSLKWSGISFHCLTALHLKDL